MKKLLLFPATLFVAGSLMSQVYFEDDFSSGNLNNWTLSDEDGDNKNWEVINEVASSYSWDPDAQSALTPDNWMVSNMIDLTGVTGSVTLEWKVSAQDQDWADENYSVYANNSDDINVMTTGGSEFTEVIGTTTNGELVQRSVDLSAFAGSQVHIAFRHHNVSDMFRLNIDDVVVRTIPNNDLAVVDLSINPGLPGNRVITATVLNNGQTTATDFDLDWSFDGSNGTENITGASIALYDTYEVQIPVTANAGNNQTFTAEITTADDDMSNNLYSEGINVLPVVPQYVADDSYGNQFDLHAALSSGQAIVLDFMASWCGPCESSTPEISEFVENNGSGQENVEALAITVESADDATVLNGLNWNGGFYEYPKFPYTNSNNLQYYHYAINHDFNSGGSIPFFVMICPNTADPANSTIVKNDTGYGQGMFAAYQTALDACPSATAKVIEEDLNLSLNVYPNPATDNLNIGFTLQNKSEATIELLNNLGQVVTTQALGSVTGEQSIELNVASLEAGMYIVKVRTANNEITRRVSVVK